MLTTRRGNRGSAVHAPAHAGRGRLLERRRDGYYNLHRIVPDQVAALAPSLDAFLVRPAPTFSSIAPGWSMHTFE
jgi:hypothetical protein